MSGVLILTAGFGEGHNAAARNLAAATEKLHGAGSARVVDLFDLASPRLNAISRRAYLKIINKLPRLWSAFYGWVDRSKVFPRHLWFLHKEMAVFEKLLREEAPDCICSAYPVYGFMADRLRARGLLTVPFHNIVTDSISINSLWTRPTCDAWFVPNRETAAAVAALGVSESRIHDTGFPVQPFFSVEGLELSPPDLSLPGRKPRVLYILNSGVNNAEETARLLLAREDWEITFAVGRDEALYKRIARAAKGRKAPTTLLRWTDQIPMLLCTHHAVISKAGGATTQEAIAARCPMIVNQIVPGQEEGNYELLRRRDIGALARTPEEVMRALDAAFGNHAALWKQWRNSLEQLARPRAAFEICRLVKEPDALISAQNGTAQQP